MKKRFLIAMMGIMAVSAMPRMSSAAINPVLTEESKAEYLKKGAEITAAAGKTLGGTLMSTVKEKGVVQAVQFCNLNASAMIDSLQKSYDVVIKRATSKPRNPANMASRQEKIIIKQYTDQMSAGGTELKPVVMMTGTDKASFYAPIKIVSAVCLKCHGTVGQEIAASDYEEIKKLYPDDKAVGYKEGDFRGIWSISFPVKK